MKLLYCLNCSNIVCLQGVTKQCECGRVGGSYVDFVNAEYWGDPVLIGFANSSFADALGVRDEIDESWGEDFRAFIFSPKAKTIKKIERPE